ncbi:MAG: hypothetical protein IV085_08670 [Thiobacillus sp.]|nr:hypothetical protein [Thiobacillus sp.]
MSATDSAAISEAVKWLNTLFDYAAICDTDPCELRTPLNLDDGEGGAEMTIQTLFRTGLRLLVCVCSPQPQGMC